VPEVHSARSTDDRDLCRSKLSIQFDVLDPSHE
jgi:hypothetical protein